MAIFDLSHKPAGWRKRLFRAPTYLYRARLGCLFAHRFVMVALPARDRLDRDAEIRCDFGDGQIASASDLNHVRLDLGR